MAHVGVVVTRLLPRDGGMVEDHGAPEAGQLPKTRTRECRETESGYEEIRRERLQGITEGRSSALRLASSSLASFP